MNTHDEKSSSSSSLSAPLGSLAGVDRAASIFGVFNLKPIAINDLYSIHSNQTLNIAAPGLLANDFDLDGDSLRVSIFNVNGLKGSLSSFADGHFSFTPTAGFAGTTGFSYTISDGRGGSATANVIINVVNSAPVAAGDHYAVHAGRTLDISAPGLLANDSDADHDPLSISVVNVSGLKGTLTPYADGHFGFTPTAGFVGTTSFTYTVSDGFGGSSTATAVIDVTNRNPIVTGETYTIRPNQTLTVAAPGLLAGDSDPDGDPLSISTLNVTGLKGSISPFADGHFNFTPTAGFVGATSFTYTVSDGAGGSAVGTVKINVVNSAPVATGDHYAVHAGKTLTIAAPGLLANDSDADHDPLSISVVNVTGLRGSLTPYADGQFSFTPTAGFVGTTSFTYTVGDGFGGSSTATVAIDVTNRNPIVNNETYTIRPNQTLTVAAPGLLAGDTDPDGDPLNVSSLNVTGLKGSISPFADGHFSFTPTAGFIGTTSFTYTVSDGLGGSAVGTAKINVVNSAPVATDDHYAVHAGKTLTIAAAGGLLANDSDADHDPLSISVLNVSGLKGSLNPYADGHFSFTPTAGFIGTTSFTYTVRDAYGASSTATAVIDVKNSAPLAGDDHYSVLAGKTLTIPSPGLLANDSDADQDPLSISVVNVSGLKGSLVPYADGHFSFTPTAGFTGTTSFTYTVRDALGSSDTATVDIDVQAVPVSTISIGSAPARESIFGSQWAAAWTNLAITTVHKANAGNAAENWSPVSLTAASPQTLAGGDIYAGDLGVSGQSAATSSISQEIDGKEVLRFNIAQPASALSLSLSHFFAHDDGSALVESGRVRLLDAAGHVVDELRFHATDVKGEQVLNLTAKSPFSAIEISAGVYQGNDFVFGGYANADGSFASGVTTDALGAKHGSEFLIDKLVLLGLPPGDFVDA